MSTNLAFFNSAKVDSLILLSEYYYKNYKAGNTLTIKDVNGVSNSDIGTYIGTLTDGTYEEIMLFSASEATAQSTATDTINLANQYVLRSKLTTDSQGTLSDEITNATSYSATTIGDSGESWTTNEWVGTPDEPIHVVLTGGTGNGQLSTIKSNTETIITIYGTFYAVPSSDTDFKILTGCKLFCAGTAQTLGSVVTKPAELGWTAMYPDITLPVINSYYAGLTGYYLYQGTAASFGAKTVTDSSLGASTNQWANYWVVVYNASTNGYQYGKITSNTSTQLTLTANWGEGTPTGTPTIRIFETESDCLKDIYFELFALTNLGSISSDSTVLANFTKLIDANGALANGTAWKKTLQDLDYLNECLATGKTYLDFIKGGITVYVP